VKTYNIRYSNENELKDFILANNLKKYNNVLIQVFTGNPGKKYIILLQELLNEMLPKAIIIGATTDGEIIGNKVLIKSTVLSITVFQTTKIKSILLSHTPNDGFYTGKKAASSLIGKDTKAVILFSDGTNTNGEELLRGFESVCNNNIIVAGGMAGDNGLLKKTFVFNNNQITDNGVVGVSLNSKELKAAGTFKYDWVPIGKEFTVTKSKKNRVYTIDNISAYDLYKKYLGEELAKKLPAVGIEFPLVIKKNGNLIARACIGDPKDGSLVFAGNINEGEKVQFAYGNIETILQASDNFINFLESHCAESIFVYSCMARRRFLKSSAPLELAPLNDIAKVAGFFTYGEFFTTKNDCELLNETMTVLMLSESNTKNRKIKHKENWSKLSSHYDSLKALSHIAYVTSMELQNLNHTLEQRVKEVVAKNRKKDQLLMQHTRLAQMGEMISMIAHQWRQPLNAISTTASGLRFKNSLKQYDEKFFDENLKKIENYTKHLSNTIEDFRNFFKPNKKIESINIRGMIERALSILSVSLINHDIKLKKDYNNSTKIRTYANEVMHVILNIVKNAEDVLIERDIKDALIEIKTYEKGDNHIIEISDNGGGIDEDIIDRIFDPYFSTKQKKGTGIGLYMSKIIIEDHCGGEISVKNSDKGAVFYISLPNLTS